MRILVAGGGRVHASMNYPRTVKPQTMHITATPSWGRIYNSLALNFCEAPSPRCAREGELFGNDGIGRIEDCAPNAIADPEAQPSHSCISAFPDFDGARHQPHLQLAFELDAGEPEARGEIGRIQDEIAIVIAFYMHRRPLGGRRHELACRRRATDRQ